MSIRDGTPGDFDSLVPVFRKCHAGSIFAGLEFDEDRVRRVYVTTCCFERGFVKVVEKDGELVGCMGASLSQNMFGAWCAEDLFLYSECETHKLVNQYKQWAKANDVVFAQISDYSKGDRLGKLLDFLGFRPAGVTYFEVF
ncbi:MAG: hypothetical protein DRR04_14190 [Gammaproteobacteria bacterium]|nr:MAG: hypothetical protein DRR04_14190 [Gammaproteobacteria bacterium]